VHFAVCSVHIIGERSSYSDRLHDVQKSGGTMVSF